MNKTQLRTRMEAFSSEKGFIRVNERLIEVFGIELAVFLSNLIDKMFYFLDNNMLDEENSFFLRHDEQMKKLRIKDERKLRSMKKHFKELGILETKLKGLPAKEFYTINFDALEKTLEEFLENPNQAPTKNVGAKPNKKCEGKDSPKTSVHNQTPSNQTSSYENHKNDFPSTLTFGKSERKVNRKVKRKKPSKSMNDKVKEKAQNKAPKSKNSNNAAKGSKDDTDLLDLWNRQPNLRSHKNPTSDVYKQCLKKLKTLRTGKLSQIVKSNELKNGVFAADIPTEWAKTAWKKKDIAKAIKNLNEWCKEGNYPKKKDWLKKLSLDAAIYNPRTGTSVLLSAFKNGVQPLFNPYEKLKDEREKTIFEDFNKFFGEPPEIRKQQQLVELAQNFSGAREQHHLAWVRHDREWDNGLSSDNGISANSIYLVRQYISYLKGEDSSNISDFKLRANASPKSLKIDGFVFNKFREDYRYYWNVDPISGPID